MEGAYLLQLSQKIYLFFLLVTNSILHFKSHTRILPFYLGRAPSFYALILNFQCFFFVNFFQSFLFYVKTLIPSKVIAIWRRDKRDSNRFRHVQFEQYYHSTLKHSGIIKQKMGIYGIPIFAKRMCCILHNDMRVKHTITDTFLHSYVM